MALGATTRSKDWLLYFHLQPKRRSAGESWKTLILGLAYRSREHEVRLERMEL